MRVTHAIPIPQIPAKTSDSTKASKIPNFPSIPEKEDIPIPLKTLSQEAQIRIDHAKLQIKAHVTRQRNTRTVERVQTSENTGPLNLAIPRGRAAAASASTLGALPETDE